MTLSPKEKAEELYDKFFNWYPNQDAQFIAKQCALIAVDEILKVCPLDKYDNLNSELTPEDVGLHLFEEYWHEVKKEIELL
jgi:hypothetical protein